MSAQDLAQSETYWRKLAFYHEQTGRSEQVARAYDQALRLSPGDAELLLSRAELNGKLARTDAAIADYIHLIATGEAEPMTVETAKSFAKRTPLLADSSMHPRLWRYTVEQPGTDWIEPGFDDSSWKTGASPFGSDASDNTSWGGPDIWLRLEFELADPVTKPLLIDAHIDDIAEFYVNGIYAGDGRWIGSGMQQLYQPINCSAEVVAALKPGRNVLAIHCHDTGGGGAGIDAKLFLDEGEQRWIDRLTEAIDKDPTNVHLLQTRSQAYAARGDTELAAADAAMLLQRLSDAAEAEWKDPDIVWARSAGPLADLLLETYQGDSNHWQVLDVVEMESAGDATLTKLDDGSILASGKNPDSDAYTIIGEADASQISALRLEALTDPSLPNGGPGRDNSNDRGNFAIRKLTVSSAAGVRGEAASEVAFDQAWADHANHPQEGLLKGHWNIGGGGGQPHQALFLLQQRIRHDEGTRLVFQMQFQSSPNWPGQNLGRFRLSVAADAGIWRNTMLASLWQDLPNRDWDRLAVAYYLVGDTQALDRLLQHKPQAAAAIGDLHASAEEWEQAVAAYGQQISPETADADLLGKRGEAYAHLMQWDSAKSDWQRAAKLQPGILQEPFDRLRMAAQWQSAAIIGMLLIEQDPDDRFLWLRTAPTLVLAGDDQGYRQFCDSMLDQFAGTTRLENAESVCKACALMPGTVDVSRLPLKVLSDALDQKTAPEWFRPWGWAARALVAHRSGDREQAGQYVQQAFESSRSNATVSYTHLTLPTICFKCRSRWSGGH